MRKPLLTRRLLTLMQVLSLYFDPKVMRKFLIKHWIKLLVATLSGGILFFAAWKLKSNWSAILSLSALLIGVFVTIILSLWIIWVVPKKQIAQLATAQADEEEKISELPAEVIALSDGIEALPESKAKVEPLQPKDLFALENEARKTLAQIVGGVVVIIGLVFTGANLWITQREAEQNRSAIFQTG